MTKIDRMNRLLQLLTSRKKIDLAEAIDHLSVSESTARRMFTQLEQSGIAIRTHGGIHLAAGELPTDYSFDHLARTHAQEKDAIGRHAFAMIEEGDVIFLDSGTTVFALALEIGRQLETCGKSFTVITNSLANLEVLGGRLPFILIGGEYRENRRDFAGYLAESVLSGLHFSRCFLGADGVLLPESFLATDFNTARLNQIILRNTEHAVVLCDASKFDRRSLVSFASFDQIDTLITDARIAPDTLKLLRTTPMRVELAHIQKQATE